MYIQSAYVDAEYNRISSVFLSDIILLIKIRRGEVKTETLTYRIDQFEGPLDLLLALITKNKVSIEDIPIAIICDQYLEYLEQCREMDMDVASEFLVMASELVLIKTKMLLPSVEEGEEDPRASLAAALLEYQRIKGVAPMFAEMFEQYSGRMVKDTDEIAPDNSVIENQSIDKLVKAMNRVLSNVRPDETNERVAINPIIKKQIVPVAMKMRDVTAIFLKNKKVHLEELFADSSSRSEVIAAFIAVLELIKLGKVGICDIGEENGSSEVLLEAIDLSYDEEITVSEDIK